MSQKSTYTYLLVASHDGATGSVLRALARLAPFDPGLSRPRRAVRRVPVRSPRHRHDGRLDGINLGPAQMQAGGIVGKMTITGAVMVMMVVVSIGNGEMVVDSSIGGFGPVGNSGKRREVRDAGLVKVRHEDFYDVCYWQCPKQDNENEIVLQKEDCYFCVSVGAI